MSQPLDFDPFELLGVDASADSATIDRAYKARIRFVHPDIAGAGGLEETKRLNVAREWLLDPDLRAQLPRPSSAWRFRRPKAPQERPPDRRPSPQRPPPPPREPAPAAPPSWDTDSPPRPRWDYDPFLDDPVAFDFGSRTDELRAFFESIRSLSRDERARVSFSLGDEPPFFFGQFKDRVGEKVWARSAALEDAISSVWRERDDESAPLLFPRGRVFGDGSLAANAYAQWLLLGEFIRQVTADERASAEVATRCTAPWKASVGEVRYGSAQREVLAFLDDARKLSVNAAERLARAWHRHMGSFLYGSPGEDWFPGALDHPKPQLVSARLAAVDASRIEPPDGLLVEHHNGYRYGLRLTAHVLGLGGAEEPGRAYLRPWRDALDTSPSFGDRARWGMPLG
ncbi:MAG: J domain-containing protein [Chloroflexota bacterium]